MSNKITHTVGGYEIESFQVLREPVFKDSVEPHVYFGLIIGMPVHEGGEVINMICTWDQFGKCKNFDRIDCFIDVKDMFVYSRDY